MLVTIQFRDDFKLFTQVHLSLSMLIFKPDEKLLSAHYAEHIGKPFFKSLVAFMSSGPVVAFVSLESSL